MVKECICFSCGSVLINGEVDGFFFPSCGLRQGDPLSSFLFIMAEDFLSLNISKMVNGKDSIPVFGSSSVPPICHLMFADDIPIFCRAICSSAAKLAKLLSLYQDSSGQCLYHDKSHFHGKMQWQNFQQDYRNLQFQAIYLGVPRSPPADWVSS